MYLNNFYKMSWLQNLNRERGMGNQEIVMEMCCYKVCGGLEAFINIKQAAS